jgi:hypothetical protein
MNFHYASVRDEHDIPGVTSVIVGMFFRQCEIYGRDISNVVIEYTLFYFLDRIKVNEHSIN